MPFLCGWKGGTDHKKPLQRRALGRDGAPCCGGTWEVGMSEQSLNPLGDVNRCRFDWEGNRADRWPLLLRNRESGTRVHLSSQAPKVIFFR